LPFNLKKDDWDFLREQGAQLYCHVLVTNQQAWKNIHGYFQSKYNFDMQGDTAKVLLFTSHMKAHRTELER